jgi:hypothetical protein
MSDASSDLSKITPQSETFTTRSGKLLTLHQMKVKHMKRVFEAVTPMFYAFKTAETEADYLGLVTRHVDEVAALVATLTDQPVDVIGDLDVDELVLLFTLAVKLNFDFFIKSVIPSLSGALGHAAEAMSKPLGSTYSNA